MIYNILIIHLSFFANSGQRLHLVTDIDSFSIDDFLNTHSGQLFDILEMLLNHIGGSISQYDLYVSLKLEAQSSFSSGSNLSTSERFSKELRAWRSTFL